MLIRAFHQVHFAKWFAIIFDTTAALPRTPTKYLHFTVIYHSFVQNTSLPLSFVFPSCSVHIKLAWSILANLKLEFEKIFAARYIMQIYV